MAEAAARRVICRLQAQLAQDAAQQKQTDSQAPTGHDFLASNAAMAAVAAEPASIATFSMKSELHAQRLAALAGAAGKP